MTSQTPSSTITHKINLISKAFHWKQNRLEIMQHIKNSRGNSINHFPPLYHGGGMTLRVHPRVNKESTSTLLVHLLTSPVQLINFIRFLSKGRRKENQEKTMISSAECSTWYAVFLTIWYIYFCFFDCYTRPFFPGIFLRLNVWSHGFLQHNRAQSRLLSIC